MKPKLRGWIHQEAFFLSFGACLALIAESKGATAVVGSLVYSFSLLFLFGVSAIYHRVNWEPVARARLKRLDHSAIFILIAGTFTPICLLGLPAHEAHSMLAVAWTSAFLGVLQSVFWVKAPKWFTGLLYVGVGWALVPYALELQTSLGRGGLMLLFGGGLAYTVGAVFYVLKRPNIKPGIFGYHELFHAMTVIAAALHFVAIYRLVSISA